MLAAKDQIQAHCALVDGNSDPDSLCCLPVVERRVVRSHSHHKLAVVARMSSVASLDHDHTAGCDSRFSGSVGRSARVDDEEQGTEGKS